MADVFTVQINPGVDPCDGQWHNENGYWVNTHDCPIHVKGIRIWQGASIGLAVDLCAALYMSTDDPNAPKLIMAASYDRYNPTEGSRTTEWTFAPDWLLMETGKGFSLARRSGPQNDFMPAQSTMTVWFWYTLATEG